MPESNGVEAIRCLGNCTEPGKCEVGAGSPVYSGHCGPGKGRRQAEGQRLTGKGGHRCRLAIAGPQDGGDDVVDKALSDAHLEQGLGHGALGHVDEGRLPQRVEQLLHAREGITMGLVLIDPGRHAELEPMYRTAFWLTTHSRLTVPGRPSRAPPLLPM